MQISKTVTLILEVSVSEAETIVEGLRLPQLAGNSRAKEMSEHLVRVIDNL